MSVPAELRVLLVEDSPVICGLIAEIINSVPGVTVAESVGSESDAIEAVGRLDVDVVILDLQLRKGTGFGVLRAMAGLPRKPIVVVLTNFALGTYREAALALGAVGRGLRVRDRAARRVHRRPGRVHADGGRIRARRPRHPAAPGRPPGRGRSETSSRRPAGPWPRRSSLPRRAACAPDGRALGGQT